MLRTALLILSGNAATSALLLARNLMVARLIPVPDYGIAATFAMVMAMIEMASTLELHQQIVQSPKGDEPRFQAALQGFQVLRGAIATAVLFALAGPIAAFLDVSEAVSAYRWLALIPLINALQHFDIHRAQRRGRYLPILLTGNMPALGALISLWPLAHLFGDWRVALWAMLLYAGLGLVTSHVMAERPYRLSLERMVIRESLRFGMPMLVNAGLMYLVFQGDKIIVGRVSGMEALAVYAMGVTLTLTPTLIGAKTIQNLFLPRLSTAHAAGDAVAHGRLSAATFEAALLTGAALVLGTFLLGAPVVHWLLGAKYAPLIPLLIPFAVLHALRVFKSGPAVAALSAGDSSNGLWGNLPRVAVLPLSYWVLRETGSFPAVIWLGAAAELAGFALGLWRLRRVAPLPPIRGAALATAITLLAIPLVTWLAPSGGRGLVLALPLALVLIALLALSMKGLRGYFAERLPGEL